MPNPNGFVYAPTPPKAWTLGSKKATVRFGATFLMPDGHGWKNYVPDYELQNINDVESFACTVYGALKAWITLSNYYGYSLPKNCSERFSGVMANLGPPGGDPHVSGEAVRQWGVIHNNLLPFDETIKSTFEFYQPKPMDEGFIAEAKKSVQKYEFGHEYVFNESPFAPRQNLNRPALLKYALARGPVCVSVHGWKKNADGVYYKETGDSDNHWTQLLDYKEGEYWLIHDQYKPFIKKVAWDTKFQTAQVYFLKENTSGLAPNDITYFQKILKQMSEMVARLALQFKSK